MKDLIEFRFTVATRQLDGKALKALKPLVKAAAPFAERLAETLTQFVEAQSEYNIKELHKEEE